MTGILRLLAERLEKPKIVYLSSGYIQNIMFTQIVEPKIGFMFWVKDESREQPEGWVSELKFPDFTVRPDPKPLWLLAGRPQQKVDEDKLSEELYQFYHDHWVYPDDRVYDVLEAYTKDTWTPELWDSCTYLFARGMKGTGKTRLLEALELLCYQAFRTGNISARSIANLVDKYHPTLLIDESQILSAEDKTELVAMLNSGQRRGDKYTRAKKVGEQYTRDIDIFDTFGWKSIAGTKELADTIEDRCVILNTLKPHRTYQKKFDFKKAFQLRTMLLTYRYDMVRLADLARLHDELRKYDSVVTHDTCDTYRGEYMGEVDPRFEELFTPLIQVGKNKENIKNFGLDLYRVKVSELAASLQARIVEAIWNLYQQKKTEHLPIPEIAFLVNQTIPEEKNRKSVDSIGRYLRNLGYVGGRDREEGRFILYHEQRTKSYLIQFGIPISLPLSVTSDTSVTPPSAPNQGRLEKEVETGEKPV